MRAPIGSLVAAALLASAPVAGAQQRGVELGVDLGIQLNPDGGDFAAYLPNTMLRAGFPLGTSGALRLEPRATFQYVNSGGSGGFANGQLALRLGLGSAGGRGIQPFVLVYPELVSTFGDFGGDTRFGFGGGAGLLLPAGDRLAVRVEGTWSHLTSPSSNLIRGAVGVSFFTH